jgi:hypothetical protein
MQLHGVAHAWLLRYMLALGLQVCHQLHSMLAINEQSRAAAFAETLCVHNTTA